VRRRSLLLLPALAACGRKRATSFHGLAFVAAAESRSVAVVDLRAFTVRGRVRLAHEPLHLIDAPLTSSVFALTRSHFAAIDLHDPSSARETQVSGDLLQARADAANRTIWILRRDPAALVPLFLSTFRTGQAIPLPHAPVSFDLHPESTYAAVALANGILLQVDLGSRKTRAFAYQARQPGAVCYRKDGRMLCAADCGRHSLVLLDPASARVVAELPLALRPEHLCVKPDGGQMFLTGQGRDAVVIVYPYRTEIAQTTLGGRAPGAMGVSVKPDYLFVANPGAGSVTIFDIQTQRVAAVTSVGAEPGAIVVTPDQQYALVLNRGSGDMAVIRIPSITAGRAKSAPLFTMVPVGARPVDAVIRRL
jgi:DNA-binding beta-propeller fold protein YncE